MIRYEQNYTLNRNNLTKPICGHNKTINNVFCSVEIRQNPNSMVNQG